MGDVHLRCDDGTAVPVQARVLSRWPDGSVRWALFDWQADLAAGQQREYRLAEAGVPRRATVAVREDTDAILVDTGALRFAIPRTRAAVLDDIRLAAGPQLAGPVATFMDIEGTRHAAAVPAQIRVLESGPLRARIELRGAYGADVHYVIRIDAFAGQSFVRLLHSFEHRGARPFTAVRQIGIAVPLRAAGPLTYRAGRAQDDPLSGPVSEEGVVVFQEDPATLRLDGAVQPGRTAGWVDVSDGRASVAVASRFAWQEYPQSIHIEPGLLTWNLWAPEAPAAAVGMGAAKTHEVVLQFSAGASPGAAALARLAEPLLAHVDPHWVAASGALPNSLAPTPEVAGFINELRAGFQRYRVRADTDEWDDAGILTCADPARERRRRGYYGMFNWGDWNFPGFHDVVNGCDTWGNLEYDTTQVLALAYAATGDPDLHVAMAAAARHYMDVDRVHSAAGPCRCAGMTHPRTALHFSFEPTGVDLGYVWTEGLLSYFYLTGDERALDAARGIAEYLVQHVPGDGATASPRQWGWPAIALLAVSDATAAPEYARAAREYARRGMAAYPPTSGRDPGVGTLADALAGVHARSGDADVREWLVRHAAAVMASPPGADPRYFPAVAYVGRITGNPTFQRAAADAVPRQSFGDWGKTFTLAGRLGFRILSLRQTEGEQQ